MKKLDLILIILILVIAISFARYFFSINLVFKLIIGILALALFLYKQIKPYRNSLFPKYKKWFSYIESVYDKLLDLLQIKPFKIGNSLSIDIASFFILALFISLLIII
jgi:hypothetical protein